MQSHRITRMTATVLGALALVTPTASAMPADGPIGAGSGAVSDASFGVSDAAQRSSGETNAGAVSAGTSSGVSDAAQRLGGETNAGGIIPDAPQVRTIVADDGLDWGDIAIGAGLAALLVALLAAGGSAMNRRSRAGLAR